jgi:hypothetical protein
MAQSGRLWTDIDQSAWVDAGSGARLGRGRLNDPLQGRLLSMVMLEVGLRQSGGPEGLADRAEIPLPDVRCSKIPRRFAESSVHGLPGGGARDFGPRKRMMRNPNMVGIEPERLVMLGGYLAGTPCATDRYHDIRCDPHERPRRAVSAPS